MKMRDEVLERLRKYQLLRLPLEPMHDWRSSPDDGGHTHCWCCACTIYRGDPVVGCYLEYISVVFCPECVADNPQLFQGWLAPQPTAPRGRPCKNADQAEAPEPPQTKGKPAGKGRARKGE